MKEGDCGWERRKATTFFLNRAAPTRARIKSVLVAISVPSPIKRGNRNKGRGHDRTEMKSFLSAKRVSNVHLKRAHTSLEGHSSGLEE
jgi:hypothetical protein